ncbi:chalcone isomerase family protein [Aliikangiella maris]|uniref:Chalcone isomerase family protein n=2 Tax=Aliikangiella maris TaxID=3162458 RepID=A0ABV3MSK2_9GAMM
MRVLILILFSIAGFFSGLYLPSSHANANINMPQLPTTLNLVGQANFSVLWWDIYQIQLFTENGSYRTNQYPLILKLTYQRKISKDNLLEETANQWKRFKISSAQQSQWLAQLAAIWPDVNKQDRIEFYVDTHNNSHFYFNGNYVGSIFDETFSHVFSQIWLAENAEYPQLAKALKGMN